MRIDLLKEFGETNKVDWKILYAILHNESDGNGFGKDGMIKKRYEKGLYNSMRGLIQYKSNTIDDLTAMATSWGIAQILGLHYKLLGYDKVSAMIDKWRANEDNQLYDFLKFCLLYKSGKFLLALQRLDYHLISLYYNGRNYAINNYDNKLKKNYERAKQCES